VRSPRGILTVLSAGALLIAGVATALVYASWRLPDPAVADRDQLLRWLVTRDLSQEPVQTRQSLAQRLEREFSGTAVNWDVARSRMSDAHRQRLWTNLPLLIQAWFASQAEQYAGLAPEERSACLDRILDTMAVWRDAAELRPSDDQEADSGQQPTGLAELVLGQLSQAIETADPEQRQQMSQLMAALQTQWIVRTLFRPASS